MKRPRCGEQDVVRYLTSDGVFFTVVQVVVLNSCVDRLGFVVVGEWRDRGTTEAIVLVVFCLLFFFLAPSWRATRVTSGSPSV